MFRFSTVVIHDPFFDGVQGSAPTKPPSNYVAGLGRGASGFTTRSDIGPARAALELPDGSKDEEAEEKRYNENQKFDEFEGNDPGLFSNAEYDEDDKEADAIWESIDQRMDSRRKDRREAKLKEEIEKYRASNPKITEQFADLKRKLHTLSADDWGSIPEIGDYSHWNKKKFESFVPISDTLLKMAKRAVGGSETPWAQTPVTDLTAFGEGRGTLLSLKLDRLSDSVSDSVSLFVSLFMIYCISDQLFFCTCKADHLLFVLCLKPSFLGSTASALLNGA